MKKLDLFTAKNGDKISQIVFGTAGYGSRGGDKPYFDMLDFYFSAGGNTLDTAAVYGESERTLGRWLRGCGVKREDIIISTKGAHPPFSDMRAGRITKEDIEHDLKNSLRDLGCGYIDIYYLHRDDISVPVGHVVEILNKYVADGSVRALGASNWTFSRIAEANAYAASHRLAGFSFSQICHSLALISPKQYGDETLVCMNKTEAEGYAASGIPVMAFTSLARGFFIKNFDPDSEPEGKWATVENLARLARLRKICAERNASPAAVSLAYLTSAANAVKTLPIIGASSQAQLAETLASAGLELSSAELSYLDGGYMRG